jgi:hypothetical protein
MEHEVEITTAGASPESGRVVFRNEALVILGHWKRKLDVLPLLINL